MDVVEALLPYRNATNVLVNLRSNVITYHGARISLTVAVRAHRSGSVQGGVVARGERRAEAAHGLAPGRVQSAAPEHGGDAL
jgi:hypothetical protein